MPAIHPDLRTAARVLPRHVPDFFFLKLARWLPRPPARSIPGVTVRELRAGSVRVLVFQPEGAVAPRPGLLWIHGGGYMIGAPEQDSILCARFSKALQATVVSVDYRLAPEHPYPAGLDDCVEAYDFLHRDAAALGVDPSRVIIGGASAGGGLTAALALKLHDTQRPAPKLQLLVYPMVDDRTVLRQVEGLDVRVWSPKSNRLGWRSYLGREPGGADVPDHAAPARRADFSGLPPAWVGVGTNDLFHDEDVAYANALRAAGVPVELHFVDGAFHGFDAVAPRSAVSRAFFDAQVDAIRRALV